MPLLAEEGRKSINGRVTVATRDVRELLRAGAGTKAENIGKILRAVMVKPGNQGEISRRAGVSNATVSDVVAQLRRDGVLEERAAGKTDVLSLAPINAVAVGIELGYQHVSIVARRVDQPHDQAREARLPVGAMAGEHAWLNDLVLTTLDLVAEVSESATDLLSIGLGVPRAVNPRSMDLTPPLLPPWDTTGSPASLVQTRLHEHLGDLTPPVLMDNDANLGALCEFTLAHPDAETLVYIKASTGIGAGVIIGGQMLRGRRGVAGEIGHMRVEPMGRFCPCGGRGCLETVVGADALVEQAKTMLGHRAVSSPRTIDELITKAREGNPVCRRVLVEAAASLGVAVGNLCNLLNPDVVVIGGTLGRLGGASMAGEVELFLAPCQVAVQQTALAATWGEDFRLVASRVDSAVGHGALILGLLGTRY